MCNIVAVIDLRFWTVLVVAYLATRRFVITPTGRDVIFFVLLVVLFTNMVSLSLFITFFGTS